MKKINVILFVFLITVCAHAQQHEILSGKLENLKGITEYNVTFDYSAVGTVDDKNEDGTNREVIYETAFVDYFNKMFTKGQVKVVKNQNVKYTINVKPTWIYKGYHAASEFGAAKISAQISIYETTDTNKIIFAIGFEKAIGMKHDIMSNTIPERISWAYERLGKNLAMQLKRVL